MATRELEVEVGEGLVAFHIFGEEIGDVVPGRPWCCDYEKVE